MNKILVTGCNGFVGTAFRRYLEQRDIPYVGTSRHAGSGLVQVQRIDGDTDWSHALLGCNTVIHLANRAHVMRETERDPLAAFRKVNVDGTLGLARQAHAAGVRRFVYISSVKVNGDTTGVEPFRATDTPAPTDPYGISKWEAEQGLKALGEKTGLEIVIVRPPLVYGPGVKANFERLVHAIQRGLPMPFGLVRNKRSMVAVDNLCDFLLTSARHPAASGQTFLVSDGHDLSTGDLIRMIAQALGMQPRLLPVPTSIMQWTARLLGKGDMAMRVLGSLQIDIAPAQRLLDWRPPVTPEIAIGQTVQHMLQEQHHETSR